MLKRKYAYLCMALFVLLVVLPFVPLALHQSFRGTNIAFWDKLCSISASLCAFLILLVRCRCLRCASCGRGLAWPWSVWEESHCPHCGEPFVFDGGKK